MIEKAVNIISERRKEFVMRKIVFYIMLFILTINGEKIFAQDQMLFNSKNILFDLDFEYTVFINTYNGQRALGAIKPTISNDWEEINGIYYNNKKWIYMENINGNWYLKCITPENTPNLRGKFVTLTTAISNELGFPPEVSTNNNETRFAWGYGQRNNLNIIINLFVTITDNNSLMLITYVKFGG